MTVTTEVIQEPTGFKPKPVLVEDEMVEEVPVVVEEVKPKKPKGPVCLNGHAMKFTVDHNDISFTYGARKIECHGQCRSIMKKVSKGFWYCVECKYAISRECQEIRESEM